jgi:hypothetical protein
MDSSFKVGGGSTATTVSFRKNDTAGSQEVSVGFEVGSHRFTAALKAKNPDAPILKDHSLFYKIKGFFTDSRKAVSQKLQEGKPLSPDEILTATKMLVAAHTEVRGGKGSGRVRELTKDMQGSFILALNSLKIQGLEFSSAQPSSAAEPFPEKMVSVQTKSPQGGVDSNKQDTWDQEGQSTVSKVLGYIGRFLDRSYVPTKEEAQKMRKAIRKLDGFIPKTDNFHFGTVLAYRDLLQRKLDEIPQDQMISNADREIQLEEVRQRAVSCGNEAKRHIRNFQKECQNGVSSDATCPFQPIQDAKKSIETLLGEAGSKLNEETKGELEGLKQELQNCLDALTIQQRAASCSDEARRQIQNFQKECQNGVLSNDAYSFQPIQDTKKSIETLLREAGPRLSEETKGELEGLKQELQNCLDTLTKSQKELKDTAEQWASQYRNAPYVPSTMKEAIRDVHDQLWLASASGEFAYTGAIVDLKKHGASGPALSPFRQLKTQLEEILQKPSTPNLQGTISIARELMAQYPKPQKPEESILDTLTTGFNKFATELTTGFNRLFGRTEEPQETEKNTEPEEDEGAKEVRLGTLKRHLLQAQQTYAALIALTVEADSTLNPELKNANLELASLQESMEGVVSRLSEEVRAMEAADLTGRIQQGGQQPS